MEKLKEVILYWILDRIENIGYWNDYGREKESYLCIRKRYYKRQCGTWETPVSVKLVSILNCGGRGRKVKREMKRQQQQRRQMRIIVGNSITRL